MKEMLIHLFEKLCLWRHLSCYCLYPLGEYEISVRYDDEHISGSPYTINVYDPSRVKVYGLEGGIVGTGLTFNGKYDPWRVKGSYWGHL